METVRLLVASTNPVNFTVLADSEASFIPWVLLFGSLAAYGISVFLFMRSFKKVRERKAEQDRQGYVPSPESRKKDANATLKTILLPGAMNMIAFVLAISCFIGFGNLSEAHEKDELRVQGWLAAEHPDKNFGDDVLNLLKGESAVDETGGGAWVLNEVGEDSGEYELVQIKH